MAEAAASTTGSGDAKYKDGNKANILKSARSLKCHLTRAIQSAERTLFHEQRSGPSDHIIKALERSTENINERIKAIEEAFLTLTSVDPDNASVYLNEVDIEVQRADAAMVTLWKALDCEAETTVDEAPESGKALI